MQARTPAERPAKRSASEAEKAALQVFSAEMQAGRTHTKAKAYADAIAAFDRALVQRPQQPRALAERGYARLLARDLVGARADLEAARERSSDPARLGPIWFNLGLVEEAAGDAEAARRAFTVSHELRPGKAAKAKLTGPPVCTAVVERAPQPGKRLASWKQLYDHLMNEYADEPGELKRATEIQRAMCHDQKPADAPLWDLCFYPAEFTNSHESLLVGPGDNGALVYYGALGSSESGACQNSGTLTVRSVGGLLHARYVEFARDWEAIPAARRDADCEAEYDECELECRDFSAHVADYVIDPAGAQRLLRVHRTTNAVPRATGDRQSVEPDVIEAALPVRVEVGEAGVTLRGGGCDETIAVGRPTP
jgi:tetratricopeptide (TPR) repeat protein